MTTRQRYQSRVRRAALQVKQASAFHLIDCMFACIREQEGRYAYENKRVDPVVDVHLGELRDKQARQA